MLVRAPVYVFQGLAASLLPNFTVLNAAEQDRFHAVVRRAALVLLGIGACIVLGTAAIGAPTMRLLYGDAFGVSRDSLVLLAIGVARYLRAPTFSQCLPPRHAPRHRLPARERRCVLPRRRALLAGPPGAPRGGARRRGVVGLRRRVR